MCVTPYNIEGTRANIHLWKDGHYLAGAYLGRTDHGGAHVYAQEVGDKAGAIKFCTMAAAQAFAQALQAAHCGKWQAVEVSRDA